MNSKLSIITVNLNNKLGLESTLISVLNQTCPKFEFIVIDGGSTDGSIDVIRKFEKKGIDYWISESDSGIYEAMNKGINCATGKYLLFLNSGDGFYNDSVLKRMVLYLDSDSDIIYGNAWFKKNGREWKEVYPSQITFSFFFRFTLNHQSCFIKKDLFDKFGLYREDIKINADWEFFLRVFFKHKATYRYVDETIAFFEHNGLSSQIENIPLIRKERNDILLSEYPYFVNDYKVLTERYSRKYLRIRDYKISFTLIKIFISVIVIFLPKRKQKYQLFKTK